MIDEHRDRDEIVRLLAEYATTKKDKRVSWEDLNKLVETEFGLKMTVQNLRKYVENRVVPAVVVTPEWIKRGIMTGEFNLNTAEMKLKLAERAYEDALNTEQIEDVDKDGHTFKRDITPTERATLLKTAAAMVSEAEATLERFGVIPGKKVTVEKKEIKADLRGAMGRMYGRQHQGEGAIDVEGTVTRTDVTTSG